MVQIDFKNNNNTTPAFNIIYKKCYKRTHIDKVIEVAFHEHLLSIRIKKELLCLRKLPEKPGNIGHIVICHSQQEEREISSVAGRLPKCELAS